LAATLDTMVIRHATHCRGCGADVRDVRQQRRRHYDQIDNPPIVPQATRVELHGGRCPGCHERFTAEAPAGIAPGTPFGPDIHEIASRHAKAVAEAVLGEGPPRCGCRIAMAASKTLPTPSKSASPTTCAMSTTPPIAATPLSPRTVEKVTTAPHVPHPGVCPGRRWCYTHV
jgi:hypothetical protein